MDYEQKYKKALGWMRSIYPTMQGAEKEDAEHYFPELKESEDERIRKAIIEFFELQDDNTTYSLVPKKDILAWLEKQGEQNPTPKFKIGDTIHKIGENTVFPRTIEKIEDGDYVCNNSHSFVNIKFQNDYELVKQKPAWSEEDEKKKELLISILEVNHPNGYFKVNPINTPNMEVISTKELVNWLKSLKDKAQPQPTSEWSKEDEEMYNEVLTDIIYTKNDLKTKGCLELSKRAMKAFNWFSKRYKSLKPQSTWKPSEEQMESIKYFIDFHRPQANASTEGWNEFKHLESLYNDLEKL